MNSAEGKGLRKPLELCSAVRPGHRNVTVHGCIKDTGHKGMHCNGQNVMWSDRAPTFKDGTPDVGLAGLARLLKKQAETKS